MTPLLRLTNIDKRFGGVQALSGVCFELLPGEVHALIGENGAGKTTLMRIVTGAHRPDAGTLEIGGRRVNRLDPLLGRTLGVAPIYQQPSLFPDLSVAENLALGCEASVPWRRIDWRQRRRRAALLLRRVGAAVDVDARAGTLRMAEQQLVEIARALGAEARVFLMDEPTAALTEREAAFLFDLIRDLRGQGVGVVYISHRLEEIEAIADRISVLRDGQLVATRPARTDRGELIRLMVGREIKAIYPKRSVPLGDVLLETISLGCQESGLRKVSLRLRSGEILGVAGLVGSGRTELARALFGITCAETGEILLRGVRVKIRHPAEAVSHGIALVPEDRRHHGVITEMTVVENTTLAILRQLTRRAGLMDVRREREITSGFVKRFAIKAPSLDSLLGTLSGGNQQKVALARWLAARPSVLILDEPTQGVDVGAKSEIHSFMVELAEQGLGILMISSELPEVLGMSDRIVVMRGGTIAGLVEGSAATPEAILALAIGGEPERPEDKAREVQH